MTVALIDDQLLGQVLRGRTPRRLASKDLYTTGLWYVRLCQAVLGAGPDTGVLSRPFDLLPEGLRQRALEGLLELPDEIGLLGLRELAPSIAELRSTYPLNILGVEVLAAATRLQAEVCLSASSPRLEAALEGEGVRVTRH